MSDSPTPTRTPTPTPTSNPPPTGAAPQSLDLLTSSRYQLHEINTPTTQTRHVRHTSLQSHHQALFLEEASASSSASGLGRTHRIENSPSPRADKRMRRSRSEERHAEEQEGPLASSPSGSSSQGDMADTEQEASTSQQSEPSHAAAPVKKKRTRTLTTPHQAAVLHALLAQSRFPTTAMREEVGRQIGLSARKVQIWFQNQRQKAKRPRGQGAPPLSRPPQYGPFPNAPSSAPASSGYRPYGSLPTLTSGLEGPSMSDPGPSSSCSPASEHFNYRDVYGADSYMRASAQLSGPGMPGSTHSLVEPHSASMRDPRRLSAPVSSFYSASRYHHSESLSPQVPPTWRPLSNEVSADDFPLTLPPLTFGERRTRFSAPGPSASHTSPISVRHPVSAPSYASSIELPRSHAASHHESPFAHQLPDQPMHNRPLTIPPPFTLQPRPQWDPTTFHPLVRSGRISTRLHAAPTPVGTILPTARTLGEEDPTHLSETFLSGHHASLTPRPSQANFDPARTPTAFHERSLEALYIRPRSPRNDTEDDPSYE